MLADEFPESTPVSAEQVALIPQCAECPKVWLRQDADRWRAYLDPEDELVFYCPECVRRNSDRGASDPSFGSASLARARRDREAALVRQAGTSH
jgi:hypothetical protein